MLSAGMHCRSLRSFALWTALAIGACGDRDAGPGDPAVPADETAGNVTPRTDAGASPRDASRPDSGHLPSALRPDGGSARADAGKADSATAQDAGAVLDASVSSQRDASARGDAGTELAEDTCGPVPSAPPEAATAKAVVQYGLSEYHTTLDNQFVGVHATVVVPAKPPPSGIIFIWPGTQTMPDGPTYWPVGGGVLQPVLTWGSSCVPGSLSGHSTWWISPVYVNDETTLSDLRGCHGGPVITADTGDRLDLVMRLDGTKWYQKVHNPKSQRSTEFTIDLRGQLQQRALFWIELKTAAKPTEDVIFEDIVLTMRDPEPGACALNNRGMNDYVSKSRVSADGRHCCIERIVLRAQGVPATTDDP